MLLKNMVLTFLFSPINSFSVILLYFIALKIKDYMQLKTFIKHSILLYVFLYPLGTDVPYLLAFPRWCVCSNNRAQYVKHLQMFYIHLHNMLFLVMLNAKHNREHSIHIDRIIRIIISIKTSCFILDYQCVVM